MLQSITVQEFKELKVVESDLQHMEDINQSLGTSYDIIMNLKEKFVEELEEQNVNQIFEFAKNHSLEGFATNGEFIFIAIDYDIDEKVLIKDNENLYYCQLKSVYNEELGEYEQMIVLFNNEIPVNDFVRFAV